jgi:hypothetical protein
MESSFLLLTGALTFAWLAGAVFIWWNLRLQERLIGSLYQLTARLVEPPQLGPRPRRKRRRKAEAPADDSDVVYPPRDSRPATISSRDHRRNR